MEVFPKVVFFTGKGGVGKSTLTLALARKLSLQSKKVVVVNFSPISQNYSLPEFEVLTLDVLDCFKEYVSLLFKSELLFKLAFDNALLLTFLKTTPGIKDTLFAGKIYHLAKSAGYDHVLVDLPSFGHAYSFFNTMVGIKQLFRIGFVEKEISKVASFFQSEGVRIDFVTLLEELPTQETIEFKRKFDSDFSFPLGKLWINRIYPDYEAPREWEFALPYARLLKEQSQLETSLIPLGLPILKVPFVIEDDFSNLLKQLEPSLPL